MHAKEYGKGGRAFVAFHGWGGDHREFAPLAARLPEDVRLLSVDLPGYGQSPRPARWDMGEIIEEIVRDLDARGLGPATLIGFCSGAVIAMLLAQRLPQRVSRIVMIDPFAFVPWYFRIFVWGEFGRRAYRTTFASPLGRTITSWVLKRRQPADDDFMGAFRRVDHEATQNWLRLLNAVGAVSRFADLTLPMDIAHGEHTFSAVVESAAQYRALFPQARVHVLRDVGHLTLVRGAKQLIPIVFGPEPQHP